MIDFTKEWQTRDGRRVYLIQNDFGGLFPIRGCIEGNEGVFKTWAANGAYDIDLGKHYLDLIPVPQTRELPERWAVFNGGGELLGTYDDEETGRYAVSHTGLTLCRIPAQTVEVVE